MAQQAEWSQVESPEMIGGAGGLNVFHVFWAHKAIAVCVLAIALGLGYLYNARATRVYKSSASVLLIKREVDLPVATAGQQVNYEDQLSTHMLLICSPLIVEKAVEEHALASLSSLNDAGNPVAAIIGGLKAERGGGRQTPDPNVFNLSYEGLEPAECADILKALVASYQGYLGETYQGFSQETVELISKAKDELHKHLTETQATYREFRRESPLLWKGEDGANMYETRMAEIEGARSEVLVGKSRTEALLDAVETALAQGGSREALVLFIGAADPDRDGSAGPRIGPRSDFEKLLFVAAMDEQMLLEDFGPDHPKVNAAHKKMELIRQHVGSMPLAEDDGTPVDFVAMYMESLRHELTEAGKQLQRLDKLFEKECESGKAIADVVAEDEAFRNEIASTKQLFDVIVKRLEEMNLIQDYGGVSAQVISSPSVGSLVRPKLVVVMSMAGVLGMLAGLGLAYLVEMADRRFESPEDVSRQLELPVVGHIPVIAFSRAARKRSKKKTDSDAIHASVCTVHLPQGRQAESYRAVRTALFAGAETDGPKVVQVTSPTPGDGKTTLAANLAVSMANSGKRVLLLDGDARRPRLHRLFSLENEVGLSSVLGGDTEVADAIQEVAIENLFVLPSGPRPENPGDQISSARLKQLFDVVRQKFDRILVDTPPLLAVTDPAVIVKHVDTVLLVIRLTRESRGTALRAAEMLRSLNAPIAGVIVNGLAANQGKYGGGYRAGGYRYGGYRYGGSRYGGYRYGGYQYGYSYGDDNGKSGAAYYSDDVATDDATDDKTKEPAR
ncbi:MAG: polysaccharide biosynthesis tyrosine autokinase [Planctomycetes bacterium]|nr:polysaccharide biosynthesis tyrosine autokinase [Planctomycetota bacterium]